MSNVDRLEKRLAALAGQLDCPECADRMSFCATCGRPVGMSELDRQRARDEFRAMVDHEVAKLAERAKGE